MLYWLLLASHGTALQAVADVPARGVAAVGGDTAVGIAGDRRPIHRQQPVGEEKQPCGAGAVVAEGVSSIRRTRGSQGGALIIAMGCGGTCEKGTLFRVFETGGTKGTTPQVADQISQK